MAARVALIDNYDSFTYNLVQYLGELGAEVEVRRHDAIDVAGVRGAGAHAPRDLAGAEDPRPGRASRSTRSASWRATVPILGVCLGHQAIGQAFGARVVRGREPVHGKTSRDRARRAHRLRRPARTRWSRPATTRSWSTPDLAPDLELTAWCDGDVVMGVRHRSLPVEGVQFHPESILTGSGKALLTNFLALSA